MKILMFCFVLTISVFSQESSRFIGFDQEYSYRKIDSVLSLSDKYEAIRINVNLTKLPESLNRHKKLSKLIITSNNLKELPAWLKNFNCLDTLYISNTPYLSYNNLDLVLSSLHSIKYLTLTNMNLDSIPSQIFLTNKILELNLRNNNISKLPISLNNKDIQSLILDHNNIRSESSLFDMLSKISNLKYLSMAQNLMDKFNLKILSLKNIEYLNLSENPLEKLPERISDLLKLKILILEKTKLESLPKSLYNNKTLNLLSIRNTNILPEEISDIKVALPNCIIFN